MYAKCEKQRERERERERERKRERIGKKYDLIANLVGCANARISYIYISIKNTHRNIHA